MTTKLTITAAVTAFALTAFSAKAEASKPQPETNPESPIILSGAWLPDDPHPRVPSKHTVVNDERADKNVRIAPTREALAKARVVAGEDEEADVVVYGGTPGGLASAIAAARFGSRVIVVEPNLHVGGMTTSGLGKSDIENRAMIGGIFREFVKAQLQHYLDTFGPKHENIKLCREDYYAVPSVSEAVFEDMLAAEGERLTVLKG